MGLFDKNDDTPMKCVYAGPDFFQRRNIQDNITGESDTEKKRQDSVAEETGTEKEIQDGAVKEEKTEKYPQNRAADAAPIQSADMQLVYMGPQLPPYPRQLNNVPDMSIMAVYRGPEPMIQSLMSVNNGPKPFNIGFSVPTGADNNGYPISPVQNKGTVICHECGTVLQDNCRFCTNCGTRLPEKKSCFCSECGAKLTVEQKFCPECGRIREKGKDTI